MAMRSALEELRKHFEDTDRTAGEVVVSWIRVAMGISMISVLVGQEQKQIANTAARSVLLHSNSPHNDARQPSVFLPPWKNN